MSLSASRPAVSAAVSSDPERPGIFQHGFCASKCSGRGPSRAAFDFSRMSPQQLQLVQQERRFYFIGRENRRIIFTMQPASLADRSAVFAERRPYTVIP